MPQSRQMPSTDASTRDVSCNQDAEISEQKINRIIKKGNIISNAFKQPTIFLVLGIFIILLGLPFGLYAFTLEGLAAVLGPISIIIVISAIFLISIDRISLKFLSIRKLNLIEIIICVIIITTYIYSNTYLTVNITNPNVNYLLVIENPGNLKNDKLISAIPHKLKINTEKDYVIVKNMPDEIVYTTSANWDRSFYYKKYKFDKYKNVQLFSKNKMQINQEFIDSLINYK